MTTPLPPELELPADLVAVIYYCSSCDGKHTYGRDYFAETGKAPHSCPNCSASFDQEERVLRIESDDVAELEAKKHDLYARRGRALPDRPKPDDPDAVRRQRIRTLEDELDRLRDGKDPKDPPDTRPGR